MSVKNSVVTIGVFDGVHIGHRAIIKKVAREARTEGLESVVITFDPHPLKILKPHSFIPSLISLRHRVRLLKELGIDRVLVMKFDRKMAGLPAEKFIKDIIADRLRAKEIFVGEDFLFGKGASADTDELKTIAARFSMNVRVIRHVKVAGRIVSSSLIRRLVMNGDIKYASRLLGRPFSILGTVVRGAKLARRLGYPTANVNPHHEAMPPGGVYAVKVKFKGRALKGVMNIGIRPTFYDHGRDEEPSIEVHIFDFHGRIYGRDLEIIFVRKLRDEKKFNTIDSLIMQIKRDEQAARASLKDNLLYR